MITKEYIIKEIESLPEPLMGEVIDFIGYLKSKANSENMETYILSESVLREDWLSPEDEEAWKDL
jgi:hypothetical protein